MFAFDKMIGQYPPGVVEADGLDIDVGVEEVLVEENCTTCQVSQLDRKLLAG